MKDIDAETGCAVLFLVSIAACALIPILLALYIAKLLIGV